MGVYRQCRLISWNADLNPGEYGDFYRLYIEAVPDGPIVATLNGQRDDLARVAADVSARPRAVPLRTGQVVGARDCGAPDRQRADVRDAGYGLYLGRHAMNSLLLGFFAPWLLLAGILVLHLVLPARTVEGYARHTRGGVLLRYRLNGLLVFAAAVIAWFAAGYSGAMPWDWLWRHRWSGAAGACALGLLVSVALMLTTPGRGRPVLAEFFLGRRDNPRLFGERVDAKMFLYIYGAALLQLNLLSFVAHHFLSHLGNPSPGVVLYLALFAPGFCATTWCSSAFISTPTI